MQLESAIAAIRRAICNVPVRGGGAGGAGEGTAPEGDRCDSPQVAPWRRVPCEPGPDRVVHGIKGTAKPRAGAYFGAVRAAAMYEWRAAVRCTPVMVLRAPRSSQEATKAVSRP